MLVSDVLNLYKSDTNYIVNSLFLKSYDDCGCVYKFLDRINNGFASRREIFIATEGTGVVEDRTVIEYIEIYTAK